MSAPKSPGVEGPAGKKPGVPHIQAKEGSNLPVPLTYPALPRYALHTCLFSLSPCPTRQGPQDRLPE